MRYNRPVEAAPRRLRIYATAEGATPFSKWLDSLSDRRGQALISARIERLRLGSFGDCRPVGRGIAELRIDFGPGYRVYFGQEGRGMVLLLCGGSKRTQSKDMVTAMAYWKDYRSRSDA